MPKRRIETYNPKTGGYIITFVDEPEAPSGKCNHENSTEIEVGPSLGHRDGDPDWVKMKCNTCGKIYYTS